MNHCADCGRETTPDTRTVHCSSSRLGCYYAGPAICLHCAHWRYREAAFLADLYAVRDQLRANGSITMAGLQRLDKVLGISTYERLEVGDGRE